MSELKFFAFDIGSENGRAVAGVLTDGELFTEELLAFKNSVVHFGGGDKWNVCSYFDNIVEGLSRYVRAYGPHLDGIGVDAWGFDFGVLDERGQLISLPECWQPEEGEEALDLIAQRMGARRYYELTGVPGMREGTAAQLINMVRRGDTAITAGRRILFIPDLINYFLTDSGACELTMAKASGLLDGEDRWAGEIFDLFDIPDKLMSDIVRPGSRIGTVCDRICELTGLERGTPVYAPVTLSAVSASVAVPAPQGNVAYLNAGAKAVCGIELSRPLRSALSYQLSLASIPGYDGRHLVIAQSGGLSLVGRCRATWRGSDPHLNYPAIISAVERARPFAGIIDINDRMFDSPGNMPELIASFVERSGQRSVDPDDIGVIARIIYESIALSYRRCFEQLKKATLTDFDTLYVVGGGANSAPLCQFCANAMGVTVCAGPAEATSVGNILVTAAGCGAFSGISEMRECVARSFETVSYKPEDVSAWDAQYAAFLSLCGQT